MKLISVLVIISEGQDLTQFPWSKVESCFGTQKHVYGLLGPGTKCLYEQTMSL